MDTPALREIDFGWLKIKINYFLKVLNFLLYY